MAAFCVEALFALLSGKGFYVYISVAGIYMQVSVISEFCSHQQNLNFKGDHNYVKKGRPGVYPC